MKRPSWRRRDQERLELGKGQAGEGKGHAEGDGKEAGLGKGREKRGLTWLELGRGGVKPGQGRAGVKRASRGVNWAWEGPVWWRLLLRVWATASCREPVFT